MYFRITYAGLGIYQALKNAISFKEWKDLKNSEAFTWLPAPKEYPIGSISYFTENGFKVFSKKLLPIIYKSLDKNNIRIIRCNDVQDIVYEDEFQVITYAYERVNNIFNFCVNSFKALFNFDISYMSFEFSVFSKFENGEICNTMNPEEHGGSWMKNKLICINPDIDSVMHFYKVNLSRNEFLKAIISHELAHEIYKNVATEFFISNILYMASISNFTTEYLSHVNENKISEETFCEFLSHEICKSSECELDLVINTLKKFKYGCLYTDGSIVDDLDEIEKRDGSDIIAQTPNMFLKNKVGMCHDASIIIDSVCNKNCIHHKCVYLYSNLAPRYTTHSYIVVEKPNKKWQVIDAFSTSSCIWGNLFNSYEDAINSRNDAWMKNDNENSKDFLSFIGDKMPSGNCDLKNFTTKLTETFSEFPIN